MIGKGKERRAHDDDRTLVNAKREWLCRMSKSMHGGLGGALVGHCQIYYGSIQPHLTITVSPAVSWVRRSTCPTFFCGILIANSSFVNCSTVNTLAGIASGGALTVSVSCNITQ